MRQLYHRQDKLDVPCDWSINYARRSCPIKELHLHQTIHVSNTWLV